VKFIFGFFFGIVTGVVVLISMVFAFVGGLVLSWKIFGEPLDEEKTTPTEEVPVT